MPEFHFKAIDAAGKVTNGRSSASSAESLAAILQQQGLFLMESREAGLPQAVAALPAGPAPQADSGPSSYRLPWPRRSIKLKEVSFFTSQLAIMVRSSLPILESLELLASQAVNPTFKAVLVDISRGVSEGEPLSSAFGRYPEIFDEVYVSLLAAGEATGDLDVMLERLAAHLSFRIKLAQNIRATLTYPAIVIFTAGVVIAFLVIFVLPTFMEVFNQLNIVLPWPTRMLIAFSEMIRASWYLLLIGAAAAWAAFRFWLRFPANARLANRVLLRTPIIGELVRNIVLTRTLRTMASLLEGGVSILKTLDLSKAAAANPLFYDLIEKVARDVREGTPLSTAFRQSPFIPAVLVGMIATGEKTGTLPEVINSVANFYEAETETSIKSLFAALEPLFIVLLGVMVGGIAISVLLPMFDIAQAIE